MKEHDKRVRPINISTADTILLASGNDDGYVMLLEYQSSKSGNFFCCNRMCIESTCDRCICIVIFASPTNTTRLLDIQVIFSLYMCYIVYLALTARFPPSLIY